MAKKIVNTFSGGGNTDISVNKYPNNKYYAARNFRIIDDSTLSNGALNNFPAPAEIISKNVLTGTVLGSCTIRDTIVLFFVTNIGISYIYKKAPADVDYEEVYSDISSTSKFNFDSSNKIEAIGRYENESIQKVYWCDDNEVVRYINIAESHTGKEASSFSFSPNVDLTSPEIAEVSSGGVLESGVISYAYQLYKNYGAETAISPISPTVPLSSNNGRDLESFYGDEVGINTNNSVTLSFSNLDTDFDSIKIYSLHYSDLNADPIISLIADFNFSETSLSFTDTGSSILENLTTTEFITMNRVFSAKTLDSKHNYLFAGNIKELRQDIDFDARAYRFNSDTTPLARLYDTDNVLEYTISSATSNWPSDLTLDAINRFNDFDNDVQYVDSSSAISGEQYMYQADGSTPGGQGPNVSYEFITHNTESNNYVGSSDLAVRNITDVSNSLVNPINSSIYKGYKRGEVYRFGVEFLFKNGQKSFIKWIGDIRFPRVNEATLDNTNYVDVVNNKQLGIEFTVDISGIPSADRDNLSGFKIVRVERNEVDKNILYQGVGGPLYEVDTSHFHFNRSSYTIYSNYLRMLTMSEYDNDAMYDPDRFDSNEAGRASGSSDLNKALLEFNSPEVVFNKGITNLAGDKLYNIGGVYPFRYQEHPFNSVLYEGRFMEYNYRYDDSIDLTLIADVEDSFFTEVKPYKEAGVSTISGASGIENVYNRVCIPKVSATDYDASRGSYAVVSTGSDVFNVFTGLIWTGVYDASVSYAVGQIVEEVSGSGNFYICIQAGTNHLPSTSPTYWSVYSDAIRKTVFLFDYIRNKFGSQYGGNSYNSRKINTYIPVTSIFGISNQVGELVPISGTSYTIDSWGGDTYVCNFDNLRALWDNTDADEGEEYNVQEYVTFPIETDINLEYRRDEIIKYLTSDSEHTDATGTNYKLREDKSKGITLWPDIYPEDLTDLYLYNDAYSRINDISTNTQVPENFQESEVFDVMVLGSNKKFNGELIDSWTKFNYISAQEVDSAFGQINKLKNYKDKLLYFQENGVGVLAIEDRSQISDNSGGLLSLGTGPVLERYDYISTDFGIARPQAVLTTEDNLYFIDENDKSIRVLAQDNKGNISRILGINSLLKSLLPTTELALGYDPENKEALFTLDDTTLVVSDMTNKYLGQYDYFARVSGVTPSNYFRVNTYEVINDIGYMINFDPVGDDLDLYQLNAGVIPLGDYSEVTVIIGLANGMVTAFDVLDLRTNSFDSISDSLPDSLDTNTDTISTAIYQNSYLAPQTVNLTPGSNISRLARVWRTKVPLTTNNKRFIDTYLMATLRFDNTTNNKYILHDIITYIRQAKV
jgi:hypothetical protein